MGKRLKQIPAANPSHCPFKFYFYWRPFHVKRTLEKSEIGENVGFTGLRLLPGQQVEAPVEVKRGETLSEHGNIASFNNGGDWRNVFGAQ